MVGKLPRLFALDAMRGICAVALMLYHYLMWNGHDVFQIGYFGVYVFFMLSGFSMWYVYAPKPLDIPLLRKFFVARLARIAPLYIVATILGALARVFMQGTQAVNADFFYRFATNCTLLFGLSIPGKTSFIPGGWSIGIEWVFYLVFPLFLMMGARLRELSLLLIVSFLLNQLVIQTVLAQGTIAEGWNTYTNFPTFIVYFIAGIITAIAYQRLQGVIRPHGIWCRAIPLAALVLMLAYPAANPEAYLQGAHVALLIVAGMVGMFFAAMLKPAPIEQRLYQFLGDISYSTYLLNFFVYQAVDMTLKYIAPGHGVGPVIATAATLSLGAAYLSYRFFEHPARDWVNSKLA